MIRKKELLIEEEPPGASAGPRDFKELYDRHGKMILRTAWRITGSREDAEDILQQIFLSLLGGDSRRIPSSITGGYLRRAALNRSLDLVRKRRKETDQPNVRAEILPSPEDPEKELRSRELADTLIRSVSRLNQRAAEVFILRDIEGLSNREIATLLGTTANTVTVTYHRARTRLLEILAGWEGLREKRSVNQDHIHVLGEK